jgi:hypothetical protein
MIKIVCMETSGVSDGYIPKMNTDIQNYIDSMMAMADQLIPYSFPVVSFEVR